MGKKRLRGPRSGVTEDARIKIYEQLQNFRASKDEVYVFNTSLSNEERAVVHEESRKMGMKSKSHGKGENRSVHVQKSKSRINDDTKERLSSVALSAQAKEVLQDLFSRHPPDDASGKQEMSANWVEKSGRKQFFFKDDIFHKPLMDEATIAKKLDLMACFLKQDPGLRQVTEERSRLPITSFKDSILSAVESHQVVLLCGETGCGKTTQVPQFLLDSMWAKGKACKIVCTQPRRISATSVAERISYERGEKIGDDIGYKIRLETKGGRNSSVVFCTNGVLLRVLVSRGFGRSQKGPERRSQHQPFEITHIVVDEIHERDRYSDLMLPILRDMLSKIPNMRLILMSATINTDQFSAYFGGCPIIRVPGFTYPVKSYYLEDVLSILNSQDSNHLDSSTSAPEEEVELTTEEKTALDDAISSAWLNDEFDMLIDSVSSQGNPKVYDYQHSDTGMTPLMVFAGKGRADDISMLLSLGADCHIKSKGGTTAVGFAEQQNHHEAAELIRKQMESTGSNTTDEQELVNKYLATANPEQVDGVLVEKLIKKICWDSDDGAILVFLPGWDEINRIRSKLQASPYFKEESKFSIFSLHSMIPSAEQKKVFKRPPRGCRKIILSTNIAETSITIDDVVYVVDSGRMKEKNYDPYNNVTTLQSSWVSKANAKQREGRAGRCQPGICYHLYSKARAASLPDYQVPEIKRTPIDDLCLQVKLMDPYSKIEDFLAKTMDPPVPETIRNAVLLLKDIGALSDDDDERLTLLGEKLGSLPVHPSTGKMLFFAILMNCLNPALTLACASDFRSPFTIPMLLNEKQKANNAKAELASLYDGQGDQLAVIAAFECWRNLKRSGEKKFCSEYFLSPNTMSMLNGMRKQLEKELIRNGFIPEDASSCSLNARDPGIVHAVLVAGLYPQIGRLSVQRGRKSVEIANGEKIHLMSFSTKSYSGKVDERPVVVYDEIVRGDRMGYIRNCTVVGPVPVMLLASDIAVVPAKRGGHDETEKDDDDGSDFGDSDDEETITEVKQEEKSAKKDEMLMSSPEDSVTVFVDGWLPFKSTALDLAQIYCLREQLLTAILFKVAHPRDVLPPVLGAYVYATACILSFDGLSGIPKPNSRELIVKGPELKELFELEQERVNKLKEGVLEGSFGQFGLGSYDEPLFEEPRQYNLGARDKIRRPPVTNKGNYRANGGERRNHPHNNNSSQQPLLPSSSSHLQQRPKERDAIRHHPHNNNRQPYPQRKLMETERRRQNGLHYEQRPTSSSSIRTAYQAPPPPPPPPLPPRQGAALVGYASGMYGPYGLRGDSLKKRQRG